jgi:hypothetical protein
VLAQRGQTGSLSSVRRRAHAGQNEASFVAGCLHIQQVGGTIRSSMPRHKIVKDFLIFPNRAAAEAATCYLVSSESGRLLKTIKRRHEKTPLHNREVGQRGRNREEAETEMDVKPFQRQVNKNPRNLFKELTIPSD